MAVLLLAVLTATAPACSLFVTSRQAVAVTASDPNADIYLDGQYIGTGSATAEVERDKSHSFKAKLGDRSAVATVGTKISTTGVLDIIGGILWLVPLIGLLGPGFWSLESTTVHIPLPPAT